ncbi:MAG: LytTR family DNA-binding domain-containing protein [Clostridium sp.]|nr:LytTR family DNA-binding domain-containing protein [Clostridium sp.]
MLRIAVCDDAPFYREKLEEFIRAWAALNCLNVQIEKFESGEEVLFDIEQTGDFVAVFMDIELSGMNGVEAALEIRKASRLVSIVFVTAYEKYFKQMFSAEPCYYIEKPIAGQKVFDVLDRIVEEHRTFFESFTFSYNRVTFNIPLKEVLYFASDRRLIRVYMEKDREYAFYRKLGAVEKELSACNHHFVRIHQSYLVNNRQIEQLCPKWVIMSNGDELPISRERKEAAEQFFMNYPLTTIGGRW